MGAKGEGEQEALCGGAVCEIAGAVTACEDAQCVVLHCLDGWYDVDDVPDCELERVTGRTLRVEVGAGGPGDGDEGTPYPTVADAVADAVAGDVIEGILA